MRTPTQNPKKIRKMLKRTCPEHGTPLVHSRTRYGGRWGCMEPGCTVCCWDGSTSTPADQETRTLRNECHRRFDPLWRDDNGPFGSGKRGHRRARAYAWLAKAMGLEGHMTHIGYFDAAQCRKVLVEIQCLLEEPRE